MSDLDIGMNDWMCPELEWDDSYKPGPRQGALAGGDRGAAQVPPLPRRGRRRHPPTHAARRLGEGRVLHARLRPQPVRRLHRDAKEYQVVVDRLARKFRRARTADAAARHRVPQARSEIGLVAIGSCRGAVREARDILAKRGISIDYMRIKAFPFDARRSRRSSTSHDKIFVVEQNRDAQLRSLLTLETDVPKSKLNSILHYGGLPMTSARHRRRGPRGTRRRGAQRGPRLTHAPTRITRTPMSFITKPQGPPPRPADERARAHAPRLRGRDVHAVRRLRPRLDHRRDRARRSGSSTCGRTARRR